MKQNKFKNISLKNTIWVYLTGFSILILFFLFLFQILFLDKYYEWSKTREIKLASLKIKEKYSRGKDMSDVLNDLLFNKGICINILDNGTLITYNNNMNKSCVPSSDVEVYKNELEKNNNKDIIFESTSKKYGVKSIVYAFAVDSDTYYFLTTSINPIDSTVTILKNQFLTVSIVILLLSFVVGFFISQKLSKPITTLSKSAKKVAKGDYKEEFKSDSNISEIQELTTSLNYAKDELSKTNELRRELLANVSHDLKTPLTMIKAYAEMVRDITYKDDEKREENLNVITGEVDRLNLLVSDILDLSKMQANIYELNEEDFDLVKLTQIIIDRYEIFSLTEKYKFVFECNKEKIMIHADKQKMEQVLYNLISNAVNYTGDDKVVKIKITDNENDSCRVEVIDTGKGIKKEEIDLIWDKYYKSNKKHKRNMLGTGLGLSIVKNIFELHNYKYGVISEKDKGSTFYFEIPKEKKCKDI